MKVNLYGYQPFFKSRREDRNTAEQLKRNNNYSLNEINSRRINDAIENLSQYSDKGNIEFLLDVARNLKYGTGIHNGKTPQNDWEAKLQSALQTSISKADFNLQEKYLAEMKSVFSPQKELTREEKQLLLLKNSIMKNCNLDSLKDEPDPNLRSLERNIDYFIASSEVSLTQKLYILKRLDYFMNPNSDYKINPQLENKKTKVLAEIINDITINTGESEFPNIKAVNQKNHGMCAAISIVRKLAAYEDKPNYVDAVLSELDASENVMVYDRFNLGSGKLVPVKKIPINFDYAQKKGYRIVDASALQWMNIADMYGVNNENIHDYIGFDEKNYDALQDGHYIKPFENEDLRAKQTYYQTLSKAKAEIGQIKSRFLKKSENEAKIREQKHNNLKLVSQYVELINKKLKTLLPQETPKHIREITTNLISLEKPVSEKIKSDTKVPEKYLYLPNEEHSQKIKKIMSFLTEQAGIPQSDDLEKATETILDSLTQIKQLSSNKIKYTVADARRIFEAEAYYRASIKMGLREKDVLNDNLILYGIPDRETRILNALNNIINLMENGENAEFYEHFAKLFDINPTDKETVLQSLKILRDNHVLELTVKLDNLYNRLGKGSRVDTLLFEIKSSEEEIQEGNKNEQARISELLGVKDDKKHTLAALKELEEKLNKPIGNNEYIDILNIMGFKDQSQFFVNIFKEATKSIMDENYPNREENLKTFKEINNIPKDAGIDDVAAMLGQIGNEFNEIGKHTDIAATTVSSLLDNLSGSSDYKGVNLKFLEINGAKLVIKEMEKSGKLIPDSEMKKLSDRFMKIDRAVYENEISNKFKNISKSELYKFSESEKNSLKQIYKKLDSMYADVNRRLINQYEEIRPELDEMARYCGTTSGVYWVGNEGNSGLFTPQQIKLLEQLTDKPYYREEDIETAVDKILKSPYSGISGTQVSHNEISSHAQYIADIKKVGNEGKYAIFHDNSWGNAEHRNTWVDSEGLLRTDYSKQYGGEYGYITNEKWQNGNYIENLIGKSCHVTPDNTESKVYKRLNPDSDSDFRIPLMSGIITTGENPEYKEIANSIKNSIYMSNRTWIPVFKKHLSKMTKEQVDRANIAGEAISQGYKTKYEKILKRIEPTPLNDGIPSKEAFNNLPDDDILRLSFEKLAVNRSYPNFYMHKQLAKVKNIQELEKLKTKLKSNAISYFDYAFGKEKDILEYLGYEYRDKIINIIKNIASKHELKLDDKTTDKIMEKLLTVKKDEEKLFTGSIKDTITLVTNKLSEKLDENLPKSEQTQAVKEEILTEITELLKDVLYFNSTDLQNNKFRAKSIRKWIDTKFNPANNEEFVEIYKKLQDMTKEEFEQYRKDIADEYLGILPIQAYDLLVKFKNGQSKADDGLVNILFYEEYYKNIKESPTQPIYKYGKNQKSLRGAYYTGTRSFDDIYRSFVFSLSELQCEKLFNKYKDINYRKYGAKPAYPKLNMISNLNMANYINSINNYVDEKLETTMLRKIMLNILNMLDEIKTYTKNISDNQNLTNKQRLTINQAIGKLITQINGNSDLQNSLSAAYKILEFDKNTPFSEYKQCLQIIFNEFEPLVNMNQVTPLQGVIKDDMDNLKTYLKETINIQVPERYHKIIYRDLKTWINEEYKKRDFSLGNQKEILTVKRQLNQYSKHKISAVSVQKFAQIQQQIAAAKLCRNSENYDKDEFKSLYDKAVSLAMDYADKYIKPEHIHTAKHLLLRWIQTEIQKPFSSSYNIEVANAAKEKFMNDLQEYSNINYPLELLKSYMYSSMKDSKTADKQANYEQILNDLLSLSMLVDIEESLMKAVEAGNSAEVKKYFDDYYIYMNASDQPDPVKMSSDTSISCMVRSLLLNDNYETAKMFVEKLGLADKFIDIETTQFDSFDFYGTVKSLKNLIKNSNKNMKIFNEEITKLINTIDNCEDYAAAIEATKQEILKRTKNTRIKSEVKICIEWLDSAKEHLAKSDFTKKAPIITQILNLIIENITTKLNKDFMEKQKYINTATKLYKLVEMLNLPESSPEYAKQQKLVEKYHDFSQYYSDEMFKLQKKFNNVTVKQI